MVPCAPPCTGREQANRPTTDAARDALARGRGGAFTEMCCGTEAGSYLRIIDSFITQLKAQGPSRTCNESKEEEKKKNIVWVALLN